MVVLERAEAFHRHVDNCNHCTTGAKDADFCYRGRVLLLSASSEALLLIESAEERDREAAKPPLAAPAEAESPRSGPVAVEADQPRRSRGASGVNAAASKLHGRVKSLHQELAPGDAVSQEGASSS